jgi:hypothetical protein
MASLQGQQEHLYLVIVRAPTFDMVLCLYAVDEAELRQQATGWFAEQQTRYSNTPLELREIRPCPHGFYPGSDTYLPAKRIREVALNV